MACLVLLTGLTSPAHAGEEMYRTFMRISTGEGDTSLFEKLDTRSRELDWNAAKETEFEGTIRLFKVKGVTGDASFIYMVRDLEGSLNVLPVPSDESPESTKGPYEYLDKLMGNKIVFGVQDLEAIVAGETYSFARLLERPSQRAFNRIFKISIVLMFSLVMVGMGLTLTLADFKRVFQKPKGILTGAALQWLLMPLIAAGPGRLIGFYDAYPFIFVGMVLIAASPGGVTSNLMTYYSKGDLALSVSLTSFLDGAVSGLYAASSCLLLR